jgi:hypothetical protein
VVLVAGLFADFAKCEVQIWMWALLASLQVRTQALQRERDEMPRGTRT